MHALFGVTQSTMFVPSGGRISNAKVHVLQNTFSVP